MARSRVTDVNHKRKKEKNYGNLLNVCVCVLLFFFSPFHAATNKYMEIMMQGRMLPHNISQGVIISNHSLVLQGVSRATAGNYSCVGYNAEGDGISPPFTLNVLCKSSIRIIYLYYRMHTTQVH